MTNEMVFEDGDGDLYYPILNREGLYRLWLKGRDEPAGATAWWSMAGKEMFARPDLDPHEHDDWEREHASEEIRGA